MGRPAALPLTVSKFRPQASGPVVRLQSGSLGAGPGITSHHLLGLVTSSAPSLAFLGPGPEHLGPGTITLALLSTLKADIRTRKKVLYHRYITCSTIANANTHHTHPWPIHAPRPNRPNTPSPNTPSPNTPSTPSPNTPSPHTPKSNSPGPEIPRPSIPTWVSVLAMGVWWLFNVISERVITSVASVLTDANI